MCRPVLCGAATVLAVALAGCTGHNDAADLPGKGPGTSGPGASPEETAKAAAVAKVSEFYTVWAKTEAGALSISALNGVAAEPIINNIAARVISARARNLRSEGAAQVLNSQTPEASVPADNGKAKPGPAWVRVTACVDTAGWTAKNPDGSNAGTRPKKSKVDYRVRNATWPDANGWRVTGQSAEPNTPC